MKKENVIKKILLKSIVGVPVGVTMLMLAYISIYFVAGESEFANEIARLQNIKIIITQMAIAGITGYIMIGNYYVGENLQSKEEEYMKKCPYKAMLSTIAIAIILAIIVMSLATAKTFSETMKVINICIIALSFAAEGLIVMIKSFKQSSLVKKINQKLKEKNKE